MYNKGAPYFSMANKGTKRCNDLGANEFLVAVFQLLASDFNLCFHQPRVHDAPIFSQILQISNNACAIIVFPFISQSFVSSLSLDFCRLKKNFFLLFPILLFFFMPSLLVKFNATHGRSRVAATAERAISSYDYARAAISTYPAFFQHEFRYTRAVGFPV